MTNVADFAEDFVGDNLDIELNRMSFVDGFTYGGVHYENVIADGRAMLRSMNPDGGYTYYFFDVSDTPDLFDSPCELMSSDLQ